MDSVLESQPGLCECVAACVHCGIRFLTHPRNAGRVNLRCPFGCRAHHRRQRGNERSAAYYGTVVGKVKKKRLNGRRSCRSSVPTWGAEDPPSDPVPAPTPSDEQGPADLSLEVGLRFEGLVLDAASVADSPLLPYVRLLVSLIEGVPISGPELRDLLVRSLRQHRIARRRRADYVRAFLHQHPP